MNLPASAESSATLSPSQKNALISLLADDDPAIYQAIRTKIISYGAVVRDWLGPHLLSGDPLLRRRAREIVDHFARQNSDTAFLSFCLKQGEEFDIEEGIWLLAQTQYPNINVTAYRALLDSYASDLRERTNLNGTAEQILASINQFLFGQLGYSGNEKNYYDPENSYLNRVIDRRTGNPISLCLVYLMVARRLKLPMSGIGLPGHFICRYQSTTEEFYVDAFNKGKLLSKGDCIKYLVHTNHSLQEGYLTPMNARRMLLRVCANLHQIYAQLELADETARLQRHIVALAK